MFLLLKFNDMFFEIFETTMFFFLSSILQKIIWLKIIYLSTNISEILNEKPSYKYF